MGLDYEINGEHAFQLVEKINIWHNYFLTTSEKVKIIWKLIKKNWEWFMWCQNAVFFTFTIIKSLKNKHYLRERRRKERTKLPDVIS